MPPSVMKKKSFLILTPVGEDRVDVDLLDVWQMRDRVFRHLEVANMFDGTVVLVHLIELL
jgi:hypothetical protein